MNQQQIFIVSLICCLACVSGFMLTTQPGSLVVSQCPPDFDPLDDSPQDQDQITGYIPYLSYQNGTGISNISTNVQICHWNFTTLDVTWTVLDNQLNADMTECNQHLYNQDVVEVFLGTPQSYMTQYVEIEVNPNGALFVANVANTSDNCAGISDTLLDCNSSGIKQSAALTTGGYKANAEIPIALVTGNSTATHLKANFFRIDLSNQGVRDYACWNPTYISPACFHVPSEFGDLFLV